MELSNFVKNYLTKEVIKQTTSGYYYRLIDGKRHKIYYKEIPDDCVVVCNSSSAYQGYVGWKLWVKDPNNKYFDIYNVDASAKLADGWGIRLNGYNTNKDNWTNLIYVGTRHYADKTAIDIIYNLVSKQIEGCRRTVYWSEGKLPIEVFDNDPSMRDKEQMGIKSFYWFPTTENQYRSRIYIPTTSDNWAHRPFPSDICQIISDVYDLKKFKKAFPQGVTTPQDLLNFYKLSDQKLKRRAKARKKHQNTITEYKEAIKSFDAADTAVKIGNKIYFNWNNWQLFVQNLKTNTLVCYTNFKSTAVKSSPSKNGIFNLIFIDDKTNSSPFKGCYDEKGNKISITECFGNRSNVTNFIEHFGNSEDIRILLQLFIIRDKYAKILELAIKSKHKFLVDEILNRHLLEKEQYEQKSCWEQQNLIYFDGSKTNLSEMLNISKYSINQLKDMSTNSSIYKVKNYLHLATIFNNLSLEDFLKICPDEQYYARSLDDFDGLLRLFAKDGLKIFKQRLIKYGQVLTKYKDYLNMIKQLKTLSATDPTVVFNPSEWPLFPEAAIKHVTLYNERNWYNSMEDIIRNYTRWELREVKYTVLSRTTEQAILELDMDPVHHLIYLEHELINIFNIYQNNIKNEAFKHSVERLKRYEFSDDKLSVVAPTQASDLTTEGAVLHHCVGSFINAVADNKKNVVFIRRNDLLDKPYYTMAISPSGNIEQVHCVYNGDLTTEGQEHAYKRSQLEVYKEKFDLIKFLKQWASAMNKKGIAINPNTIRPSYGALAARN